MKTHLLLPRDGRAEMLATAVSCSPLTAQILLNRGIYNSVVATNFLTPSLKNLQPPEGLVPTPIAQRIAEAITSHKKITIFGDYDVDGLTGTATLYLAFRHLGADVHTYTPHRQKEGYGISPKAVHKIHNDGTELLITVDCGISCVDAVDEANLMGLPIIVTDHHPWSGDLPSCDIVHPHVSGSPTCNPDLCGSGVAFKLAWAVGKQVSGGASVSPSYRDLLMELIALTAMATIADVVPLTGENRVIASSGINKIPTSTLIGVQALATVFATEKTDDSHIGFTLAPAINAASRMGHAEEALRLLVSDNLADAVDIALSLKSKNEDRKTVEQAMLASALTHTHELNDFSVIVVHDKDWYSGVAGIVASRLKDIYHKPAFVLVDSDGTSHGSARSIPGCDLRDLMDRCKHLLGKHGGHAMASGLQLPTVSIDEFRDLACLFASTLDPTIFDQTLQIDAEVRLSTLDVQVVKDMERLAPFGNGNPKVILRSRVKVEEATLVGKNKNHLMMEVVENGISRKAIMFARGETTKWLFDKIIAETPTLDIAYQPTINRFRGNESVTLVVEDILDSGTVVR